MKTSKAEAVIAELVRFAEKHGEVLHHRPWRKRCDGNEWFFGAPDTRYGGVAPAYRTFKFSEEQARLFDEACFRMKEVGDLRYLGPALGDSGAIYEIPQEADSQ